jgi:site-specific DNA-methyltransferase (adenine-specific)
MANIDATKRSERSKDDWGTPLPLFSILQHKFGEFTLDPCTSADNPLGTPHFFTEETNGLAQSWQGHRAFVNPPYSQIKLWAMKAWSEARLGNAEITLLVAARPDTRYWWDFLRHGDVYFIKGRLKFVGAKSGAPFPSAVVHFDRFSFVNPEIQYLELSKEERGL